MKDDLVIDKFIEYLNKNGYSSLYIIARNVKIKNELFQNHDVDAIAPPIAIEHTKVMVFPNQIRNELWAVSEFISLEKKFSTIDYSLRIIIKNDIVIKGTEWKKLNKAFENWIKFESPKIEDGTDNFHEFHDSKVKFRYQKGLFHSKRLFFVFEGEDDENEKNMLDSWQNQLMEKCDKLRNYKIYNNQNNKLFMLVESEDKNLMCIATLTKYLLNLQHRKIFLNIDQVWAVDTSEDNFTLFNRVI